MSERSPSAMLPLVITVVCVIACVAGATIVGARVGADMPSYELPRAESGLSGEAGESEKNAAPDESAVLSLFAVQRPKTSSVAAPAPPPLAAPVSGAPQIPLRFIGQVVEESGDLVLFFKDTSNGRIISTRNGGNAEGWRIISSNENEIKLSIGGTPYAIPRRQ